MTRAEAGKLGNLISLAKRKENNEKIKLSYTANPNKCKCCGKAIPFVKRQNVFCNHSCAATITNVGHAKNWTTGLRIKKPCSNCGKETTNNKYCSRACYGAITRKASLNRVLLGDYKAIGSSPVLKTALISTRGASCELCHNSQWLNSPINLTVHHKDGKSQNNKLENLQLLCWNCHSYTHNFGSKNRDSDRVYRYANVA